MYFLYSNLHGKLRKKRRDELAGIITNVNKQNNKALKTSTIEQSIQSTPSNLILYPDLIAGVVSILKINLFLLFNYFILLRMLTVGHWHSKRFVSWMLVTLKLAIFITVDLTIRMNKCNYLLIAMCLQKSWFIKSSIT